MVVFISWSGNVSKRIALKLRTWLKQVIQVLEPWMSDVDIAKGVRWFPAISEKLNIAKVGIICITPQNYNAPWLHFEAGAIAKHVNDPSFVCAYLFKMEPKDLGGPMSEFNATVTSKEDTKKLITTLNDALEERKLSPDILTKAFEQNWPELERELESIKTIKIPDSPARTDREIWEEILEYVRQLYKESRHSGRVQNLYTALQSQLQQTVLPVGLLPNECPYCGAKGMASFTFVRDDSAGKSIFKCMACGLEFPN